ncbi:MAG: ABC transporter substrate-binding protein, partial [Actinobacteria bacterium]|nr:ABC transporter substrate-binding protein [Actinomycetota bacterium]
LVVALAMVAGGCGGGDDEGGGGGGGEGESFEGPVTILSLWGGSEREAFQKVLDGFTEKTGIETKYETARDFEPVIRTRLAAGNPPMAAIIPRPGPVEGWAQDGSLISFSDLGVDEDLMKENYAQGWIDLGTVDEEVYGIPVKANSKTTLWYDPSRLDQEMPEDWQGLLDLTEELKGGELKPWAVGASDSWTLTDWFEVLYVKTHGPELYNQLFSGELEFTDQTVKDTITEMQKVLNDETLPGGVEGALGTDFVTSIGQVFGQNPKAQLYYEGGFVGGIALGEVNPNLKPGETIDFVPFPKVNDEFADAILGAGDLVVGFENNDGVRQLIDYLMSEEAATIWAETGAIVSPNKAVDTGVYPNELAKKEAEQLTGAEVFVFDGSDLLPGGLSEDWPAVLQNAIRDPDSVDQLLEDFQDTASGEFSG